MGEKVTQMTYIKLFVDYLDAIEELCDAERGRLFTALLEYGRTGAAPRLSGSERFVFPLMRAQIDRDNATYAELSATRSAARKNKSNQNEHLITSVTFDNNCTQDKDKDKDKDEDKDKEKEKDNDKDESAAVPADAARTKQTKFIPPSVDEVQKYCEERGNTVNPERFVDYYSACGWLIGRHPMKDWKAAVRSWEKNGFQSGSAEEKPSDSSFERDTFFEAAVRHSMERRRKRELVSEKKI